MPVNIKALQKSQDPQMAKSSLMIGQSFKFKYTGNKRNIAAAETWANRSEQC